MLAVTGGAEHTGVANPAEQRDPYECSAQRRRVAGEVGRARAEVHEAAAGLERLPPAVRLRRLGVEEGDQLDVGAVGERDQRVVRPRRVPRPGPR